MEMTREEALKKAVQEEKRESDAIFQQQLQLSPAEQRRQGILLYPLVIRSRHHKRVGSRAHIAFETSFPINNTYFREGVAIRCKTADGLFEGRLTELETYGGTFYLADEEVPTLHDQEVQLLYTPDDRTLRCMELGCRLQEEHPQLQLFKEDLLRNKLPFTRKFEHPQLNERQQLAAGQVIGTDLTVVIQGPPGTGKTHTLALAVQELVRQQKRVILCAPSNTAVDHLCHQLLQLNVPLLRVGNEEKMSTAVSAYTVDGYLERGPEKKLMEHLLKSLRKAEEAASKYSRNDSNREAATERRAAQKERTELRKELRKVSRDARQYLLGTIPVIAGTPVGLFNELPKEFVTDVVVLDEAGQAPEPLAWLAASFGKRLVLCGDPQQLPPVVLAPKAAALRISLLEEVMRETNTVVLNEQFRMAPEVVAGINPYFYKNALQTAFADRKGSLRFIDMAGFGDGEQQDETTGSTFHPDEARIVATVLRQSGFSPASTVVLSPYNAQLGVLQQELGPEWRVSTIDSIQGQEAENIVISLTRSNAEQQIGFLNDYRRTNVAISRAKSHCLLIGDSSTLGGDAFYTQLIAFIEEQGGYQSAWEFVEM